MTVIAAGEANEKALVRHGKKTAVKRAILFKHTRKDTITGAFYLKMVKDNTKGEEGRHR